MTSRISQANGICALRVTPAATFWAQSGFSGREWHTHHVYQDAYKNEEVHRRVMPASRVYWFPRTGLISITETRLDASGVEVTGLGTEDDSDCPICKDKLSEQSGMYDDTCDESTMLHGVARHEGCGRMWHSACLASWIGSLVERDHDEITCPMCRELIG